MRLLKRNTTTFEYRPYLCKEQRTKDGKPTFTQNPVYGDPVQYVGNISVPSGFATDNLFGVGTPYTHVLVMDNPDADIKEEGIITWKGCDYDIKAVRPSINVLSVALKKRTVNHAEAGDVP